MIFDIVLLGDFSVRKNGELIKFPFKKTAVLFAYLAINQEVNRKDIAKLLWENVDETEVRKNLRNALYTLRKVIDPDIIKTDGNSKISLNAEYTYNCDYDKVINVKNPLDVVNVYGRFLDSINLSKMGNYQKWVNKIQNDLLNIYIDACDKLIYEYQETGKLDDALKMLLQKVEYYEYDEVSYREIMQIYLEKREYDKAIEAYTTINGILSNGLKINCETETIKLYEKVVNKKLSMLKTKNVNNINPNSEVVLNKLTDAFDSLTKYNQSSYFKLNGEAGVGKTFIINQFLSYVKKDVEVFKMVCYLNDEDYVFRSIAPFISELSIRFKTLSFNNILTFTFKDTNMAFNQESQYYYFDKYFIKMMKKLLNNRKLVLIIEDVHYMDVSSVTLFYKLCEAKLNNLMIIFTSSQSKKTKISDISDITNILIPPWSKKDVENYLSKKQNLKKLPSTYIDFVLNKTNGNPYYIKYIDNFEMYDDFSIDQIYLKIYESLNNDEQRIIDLLAIFVRSTSLKNLQTLVTLSDLQLIEILRRLEEKEIITAYKNDLGIVYQISSELFKNYVYTNLNKHVKRQLHNKIANNLEENSIYVETSLYLYQSLIDHFNAANNKVKELEYRIKYYSIKNYCACELFSIVEITLIDSLYLSNDSNFEVILDELESELYDLSGNNIFSSRFKEMAILFYVMKARYYLMRVNNNESHKAIKILMSVTDNMDDIINRHNTYYLMIYYSINANDNKSLNMILEKLLKSIQLLDTFSIEYTKSMITYSRFRGYFYMVNMEYEKAIHFLKKGLTITNTTTFDIDMTFQASIYHYLGQVYMVEERYNEAIESFNRCLRILMRENLLVDAILVTRGFLAISYYLNDENAKAKEAAHDFREYQSFKNFYLKERLFNSCIDLMFNKNISEDKPLLDNEFDYKIFELVYQKYLKNLNRTEY